MQQQQKQKQHAVVSQSRVYSQTYCISFAVSIVLCVKLQHFAVFPLHSVCDASRRRSKFAYYILHECVSKWTASMQIRFICQLPLSRHALQSVKHLPRKMKTNSILANASALNLQKNMRSLLWFKAKYFLLKQETWYKRVYRQKKRTLSHWVKRLFGIK